jgi:4-hydroxybenzoate polyprenyltransferase
LVTLYPIASGILYLYSAKYKNSIVIGNIIVSFFVAFVPAIILVAERDILFNDGSSYSQHIVQLIVIYAGFSFFVNLIREIIKDVEDLEGDTRIGYITLPIKYGIAIAKRICIGICVFTILFLICWIYLTNINLDFRVRVYLLLLVAAPLAIVIQILTKTTNKRDFSKISTILKWTMLAGLGALILISNILFQS